MRRTVTTCDRCGSDDNGKRCIRGDGMFSIAVTGLPGFKPLDHIDLCRDCALALAVFCGVVFCGVAPKQLGHK